VQSPEIVAYDSGAVPMPVVQSLEIESSEEKIPDVFEDVEKELSLLDDRRRTKWKSQNKILICIISKTFLSKSKKAVHINMNGFCFLG
jgi:hypothetical protein